MKHKATLSVFSNQQKKTFKLWGTLTLVIPVTVGFELCHSDMGQNFKKIW